MKSILFYAMLYFLLGCQVNRGEEKLTEVRGVWLTNVDSDVLSSRQKISEAMDFLAGHHFNAVYPVVWNKGVTLYKSSVMDSMFNIPVDTLYGSRDPLAEVIEEAHKRNIAVIAWFEFGFSSSYKDSGGYLLRAKPHWAAKDVRGNLLKKNGFEWMNAYHPEVQGFILSLIEEVVRNYEVDGIQGDDRLPAQPSEGGYSEYTVNRYKKEHDGQSPPSDSRDTSWLRWRADILNDFAKMVYERVKAIKSDVLVTWSPSIFPWSYEEYLQDWPAWVRNGWADMIHFQNYRYSMDDYQATLDSQEPQELGIGSFAERIYPGVLMNVGDYLIEEDFLMETIAFNRARGYRGEVFFFYEGLRKNNGRLAEALKEKFYRTPAIFQYLK